MLSLFCVVKFNSGGWVSGIDSFHTNSEAVVSAAKYACKLDHHLNYNTAESLIAINGKWVDNVTGLRIQIIEMEIN